MNACDEGNNTIVQGRYGTSWTENYTTSDLKLRIDAIFSWIEEINAKKYHCMNKTIEKEPNQLVVQKNWENMHCKVPFLRAYSHVTFA